MKPKLLIIATALALGMLAGCDRKPEERTTAAPASTQTYNAGAAGSTAPQSNTPSTPANVGAPSADEKAHGSNPTQQQVDPKQPEQHRDFQQRGDGAGPKHPGGG